jgi:mRNA interferase YafQ
MLEIRIQNSCRKDMKRAEKRGKDMQKFWSVVARLREGSPLEPRHRPHRLTGIWYPFMECHIEPDWLLVYRIEDDVLVLSRTGTHSDLFD